MFLHHVRLAWLSILGAVLVLNLAHAQEPAVRAKKSEGSTIRGDVETDGPIDAEVEAIAPNTPSHGAALAPEAASQMGVQVRIRPKKARRQSTDRASEANKPKEKN